MKTDRKTKKRGALLASLQSGKPGDVIYTHIAPKGVTSYATLYGFNVKTERVLVLSGIRSKDQKVEKITKVTINYKAS